MQRPKHVAGWCPHYDEHSGQCYLSESTLAPGNREHLCKSDTNCKSCANYQAWMSGKNYRNK